MSSCFPRYYISAFAVQLFDIVLPGITYRLHTLIGIIDFYHFVPLSVTLTIASDYKVSANAKPFGFIFWHTFQLMGMDFDMASRQSS